MPRPHPPRRPPMTAALSYAPAPPSRVVLRPAPRREPPFDDELPDAEPACRHYDQRLPFARVVAPAPWRPTPSRPNALARSGAVDPAPARRHDRDGGRAPPAAPARRAVEPLGEPRARRRLRARGRGAARGTGCTGPACAACARPNRPTAWPNSARPSRSGPACARSRCGSRPTTAAGAAPACSWAEPGGGTTACAVAVAAALVAAAAAVGVGARLLPPRRGRVRGRRPWPRRRS